MNDTSRQILSTNKSISTQVAKFCRFTSAFCKILSIKTLFKQKQGIKYTLFKFQRHFSFIGIKLLTKGAGVDTTDAESLLSKRQTWR